MASYREKRQYRVNKKGSECFRADTYGEAKEKLDQLTGGKPGNKYTIQYRTCRYDDWDQDALLRDYLGRPQWTPWFDFN